MNKITILGSGTSTSVPILGCKCKVCQSKDPRNKRLRTSALIESKAGRRVLIDATPDLRTQLLEAQTDYLDAVIITHDHADHTHGMDDLRPFTFKKKQSLPVFTDSATADDLKKKFAYIFDRKNVYADKPILGGGIPLLDFEIIAAGPHEILDMPFIFHSLPHGHAETLALQQGKLGYVTDCREIPEKIIASFRDAKLEILVIDCLRLEPHQTHLHLALSLKYIEAIGAKTAVLTHVGHEWDYLELLNLLDKRGINNVFPAIDGQSFYYSN